MVKKQRGLGRGLDALLGTGRSSAKPAAEEAVAATPAAAAAPDEVAGERLQHLPVDQIQRGRYQPRTDMQPERLEELADSIRAQGVVQPILVRPISDQRFEIIAGERRWRAAQIAGLHEIPAVVRDVPDRAAIAMALIENIQRENLNPMEEARALQRLMDEFEMTQQQAAEAVGRSRSGVANLLRLLELAPEVKALVEQRKLEMGHARALLALPAAEQVKAARHVAEQGMSVRQTEQLVRRTQAPKPAAAAKPPALDPDIRRLQDELMEKLGAQVQFQHQSGGKGKVVIHYNNLDELEGILNHIQ